MSKAVSKKHLQYQQDAVDYALEFLIDNNEFNLQAPTGSGKTFILANLIDNFLESDVLASQPTTFVFLAPSTGKLDYQNYEKFNKYLMNNWVNGFSTNYIGNSNNKESNAKSYLQSIDYFKPNNVYFFGWNMFHTGTRITEINSERNNIYRVISNTKEKNINIVLIIDEAHINNVKKDEKTKSMILEYLNPYKTIKLSATLEQSKINCDYKISYDKVIDECAIKKVVEINGVNAQIKDISNYHENEQLILSAIAKQKEIKEQYFKRGLNIKPLILVQIPDKVVIDNEIDTEDLLLNSIVNLLEQNGYKQGINFAIWLDKLKTNSKQEIVDNNSEVEILIFKQAIAIGWDVPRANILVRIREAKSKAFNIQTLGRILRNPFFKYFNNELIDNAFVFTRDEKYRDYIKQESICYDNEKIFVVKRSSKAKDSTLSINKIKIKLENLDKQTLIDLVSQKVLEDHKFKDFLNYEISIIKDASNVKFLSKNIFDNYESEFNKAISQNKQMQLDLVKSRQTLKDIYIKYKTITKSNSLINNILEKITQELNKYKISIKNFYLACINNWNKSLFVDNNTKNNITLLEKIKLLIANYQKDFITYQTEQFYLPNEYKFNSDYFNCTKWDEINTYEIKFTNMDKILSKPEIRLYKENESHFCNYEDKIHIFRNGTNDNIDYYVEYFDVNANIRKFFPDFILVNEEIKKFWIMETKGRNDQDIDKNTEHKMTAIRKYLQEDKINNISGYKLQNIFKVTINNEDLEYQKSFNEILDFKNVVKEIKSYNK